MNVIDLLVCVLATYRVTDALTDPAQVGPARILERLYGWFDVGVDRQSKPRFVGRKSAIEIGSFRELITCRVCLPVVMAAVVCALHALPLADILVDVAAVAGGVRLTDVTTWRQREGAAV